jgi:DNA (cytosine-5)-methyltransferase 1
VTGDITHTLKAEGFDASEDGTGRGQPIVSVALRGREGGATAELGEEIAGCLRASSGGGDKPHVLTPICFSAKDYGADATNDLSPTLRAGGFTGSHANGGVMPAVSAPPMAVRRLMPVECERLQAFPDQYTQVPVRGKPAADGPRYKALGNSMCVNVMRWLGQRIDAKNLSVSTTF